MSSQSWVPHGRELSGQASWPHWSLSSSGSPVWVLTHLTRRRWTPPPQGAEHCGERGRGEHPLTSPAGGHPRRVPRAAAAFSRKPSSWFPAPPLSLLRGSVLSPEATRCSLAGTASAERRGKLPAPHTGRDTPERPGQWLRGWRTCCSPWAVQGRERKFLKQGPPSQVRLCSYQLGSDVFKKP